MIPHADMLALIGGRGVFVSVYCSGPCQEPRGDVQPWPGPHLCSDCWGLLFPTVPANLWRLRALPSPTEEAEPMPEKMQKPALEPEGMLWCNNCSATTTTVKDRMEVLRTVLGTFTVEELQANTMQQATANAILQLALQLEAEPARKGARS